MNKRLLLLLCAILPIVSVASSRQTTMAEPGGEPKRLVDAAMFYYTKGSTFLYQDYKTNDESLKWLHSTMSTNRVAVLTNKAHFQIIAYLPAQSVGNSGEINEASIQGSILRAYLKTQYGVNHQSCAFAIDTTQGLQNVVQLQLVSGALPKYANAQICYAESRSAAAVQSALSDYRNGVPYMSYLMYQARQDINFVTGGDLYALRDGVWLKEDFESFAQSAKLSELATVGGLSLYIKTVDGTFIAASVDDIDNGVNILYTRDGSGAYVFASAADILAVAKSVDASFPSSSYVNSLSAAYVRVHNEQPYVEGDVVTGIGYRDYPIMSFKTNLLSWAGATPNIGVEFYMGKMVSLEFHGRYTWLSDFMGIDKAYYLWSTGAELKFWLKNDRKFNGFYLGLYGMAGQYDIKFSQTGNQGDFYAASVTCGYVLPVGKHFNVEFGLGVGAINYQNKAYRWTGTLNVPIDPINPVISAWKILPTKATIALMWKF